jgi:phosphohistidine swiveling domain-containing protein
MANSVPKGQISDDWCIDSSKLSERFPIYTRFNANDVLPDPISPLGADLIWNRQIMPGCANGYAELGAISVAEAHLDPEAYPAAAFRYGHMYVSVTTARLLGIRSGIGWEAIDAAFFGSHPDAPPHETHPTDGDPEASTRLAARTEWTLTTTSFPQLEEDTRIADRLRAQRPDFNEMSNAALVAYARSLAPYERMTWRGEVIASAQSAVGPAVIGSVLPADSGISPFNLVGPPGDVVSAAPSYALWDLSRIVRNDTALSALFDEGITGIVPVLKDKHPDFHQKLQVFLREFGYRGPSEWDLGADSWETRPELPLGLVDRMRQLSDDQSPASRRGEASAAAEALVARIVDSLAGNDEAIGTLRMGLNSARRFAGWRELGKSNCIKVINEARVALLEMGRRLTSEGHFTHPRQIFMALDGELDRLVLQPDLVTAVIAQREADWKEYAELDVPLFLDARLPRVPIAQLKRVSSEKFTVASVGDTLTGTAAAAGKATGRARIITDTSEIAAFEPGDVLVAPQTDPSWTPLFVVASAVVVGVGAPNSHAMIVSRELGIPCVASLEGAIHKIPEGAIVTVDGSTGSVTIDSLA